MFRFTLRQPAHHRDENGSEVDVLGPYNFPKVPLEAVVESGLNLEALPLL
jgi:hypothetical protein